MRHASTLLLTELCFVIPSTAIEEKTMSDPLVNLRTLVDLSIDDWKFCWGHFSGPEQADYDDSDWDAVRTDHKWFPPDSRAWYRKRFVIPDSIAGVPTTGDQLWLEVGIDDDGIVWLNGEHLSVFHGRSRNIRLPADIKSGDTVVLAIQDINHAVSGQLKFVELHSQSSEPVIDAVNGFLVDASELVVAQDGKSEQRRRADAVTRATEHTNLALLRSGDVDGFIASIAESRGMLKEALEPEREQTRLRLQAVARNLDSLCSLIDTVRGAGLDPSYQVVTSTVVENYLVYAEQDISHANARLVRRGAAIAGYLDDVCLSAIRECRALLDGSAPNRPVERFRTGDVEIIDGTLSQNGRPVFLTGFGHFDQVIEDIPKFQNYGYNIIQAQGLPRDIVREDFLIDTSEVEEVLAVLDRAAEHDIAVNVLMGPSMPHWAMRAHPDMRNDHLRFFNFRADHPIARKIHRVFLDALIPRLAGHPALFSYDLINEPTYEDFSESSQKSFREWLRAKHGTVEQVNERHGSDWLSFDDIVVNPGIATSGEAPLVVPEQAEPHVPRPLWLDWCRFNQERFYEWHVWMRDIIREYDSDTPIHTKVMGTLFDGQRWYQMGIDHEQFSRLDRVSGNDCYSYDRPDREYEHMWLRQAMYYDFQRSVAPENPIYNSENHPVEDGKPEWVSGEHMRAMLWQGAIHGQGATTTWVWEREERGELGDNIMTRPNCVEAFGRASLDLQRLAPEIATIQRSQSDADVAILFSDVSLLYNDLYIAETQALYEGLYFLDTPIRYVTEAQIADGRAQMPRVLVAPMTAYVTDETVEAVDRFVREGGVLVTSGNAFSRTEYGKDRSVPFLSNEQRIESGTERGVANTWQHGEGKVVYFSEPNAPKAWRSLLDPILDDAGVDRPIRLLDHRGIRPWGVRMHVVEIDGRRLVYVINLLSDRNIVQLVGDDVAGATITDLVTMERRGPVIQLEPLEFMLLELVAE
jgi:hypothetical protein